MILKKKTKKSSFLFILAFVLGTLVLSLAYITLREWLFNQNSNSSRSEPRLDQVVIHSLTDNSLIMSDQGWVHFQGNILSAKPEQHFYLIVETMDPSHFFVQQEIWPAADGSWQADAKFGSLGHSYVVYVVASSGNLDPLILQSDLNQLPVDLSAVSKKLTVFVQ